MRWKLSFGMALAFSFWVHAQEAARQTVGATFPAHSSRPGAPIDFRRFFPLEIVDAFDIKRSYEGAEKIERRPNTILIANFNHGGDRYLVEIPQNAFSKVYTHFAGWVGKIAKTGHESIVFEMDPTAPELRFFKQEGDGKVNPVPATKKKLLSARHIVLSANALTSPGEEPALDTEGMNGGRLVSFNLKSISDLETEIEFTKRGVELEKKNFLSESVLLDRITPDQVNRYFDYTTRMYDSEWIWNIYHMICNNCASPHYRMMDAFFRPDKGGFCEKIFFFIPSNSPGRAGLSLKLRGLSSGKSITGSEIPFLKR